MPAVEGRDYISVPYQGGGVGAGWGNALSGISNTLLNAFMQKHQMEMADSDHQMKVELHKESIKKLLTERKLDELKSKMAGFGFMETQPGQMARDPTGGGQVTAGGGDPVGEFDPTSPLDQPTSRGMALNLPSEPREQGHAPVDFSGFEEFGIPGGTKLEPRTMQEKLKQDLIQKEKEKRANDIHLPEAMRGDFGGMTDVPPELLAQAGNLPRELSPDVAQESGLQPGRKYSKADLEMARSNTNERGADRRAALGRDAAAANASRVTPEDQFRMEETLRDNYSRDTKVFQGGDAAIARMRGAAKAPNGYDDAALIYGYNKLLDDISVVREGERDFIAAVGSMKQRAQGFAAKLANGEQLTPAQRDELMKSAEQLHESVQPLREQIDLKVKQVAESNKLRLENVIGTDRAGRYSQPEGGGAVPKPAAQTKLPDGRTRYTFPDGSSVIH